MKCLTKLFVLLTLTLPVLSHAKLLQIIHTNDLHSYFVGYADGRGGYAKVVTKIRELKEEARRKNIEVLHLDGGDWGEGTSFFMSEKGSAAIKALDMMGVEVATIGNHDHMMGGNILGQQIRRGNTPIKFISANLVQTPEMNIGDILKPYVDLTRGGMNIRIIGLSTAAAHFQYQVFPGFILPPVQVGAKEADAARKAGKDLVIALTHIGVDEDVTLVKGSSNIDLIVGGHSHTRLEQAKWVRNKNGRWVPIVQAHAHGLVVGSLLIDVAEGGEVDVVDYKLHDIEDPQRKDPAMVNLVQKAADDRNHYFGGRWDEVIGSTTIPMAGHVNGHAGSKETCWGRHMARMSLMAAKANMGIHLAAFEGMYKDPGDITFGDMVDNFPHQRKFGDPGWEISTINVSGNTLKILLRAFIQIRNKFGISFYGFTYKKLGPFIYSMKINGQSIVGSRSYSIAFPAEIGFALRETLPLVQRRFFPNLRNTGKFFWPSMESYIKENSPMACI